MGLMAKIISIKSPKLYFFLIFFPKNTAQERVLERFSPLNKLSINCLVIDKIGFCFYLNILL